MIYFDDLIENTVLKRLETTTKSINSDFLDQVRVCFHDPSAFDAQKFQQYPTNVIIDYLTITHEFYLQSKMPMIQQYIGLMLKNSSEADHKLLLIQLFFESYQENLEQHIKEEETQFFPFFQQNMLKLTPALMEKCEVLEAHFKSDHSDTEIYLQKMLVILSEYQPLTVNKSLFNVLQTQIELFLIDLSIHARIEEEVLFESFKKRLV